MTRPARRLRVLLTEGSSLSARQAVYALGRCGYHIEICDPKPLLCQARYSRYVRACHRCPSFTADPLGYVRFLSQRLRAEAYDVLLPVHDQAFLLARFRDRLRPLAGLALPEFAAMERLQSKAAFLRLLVELDLPHPATELVRKRPALERACSYPCYIKLAYSTAGCGVWHVASPEELRPVADLLEKMDLLDGDHEILVCSSPHRGLWESRSVFFSKVGWWAGIVTWRGQSASEAAPAPVRVYIIRWSSNISPSSARTWVGMGR